MSDSAQFSVPFLTIFHVINVLFYDLEDILKSNMNNRKMIVMLTLAPRTHAKMLFPILT